MIGRNRLITILWGLCLLFLFLWVYSALQPRTLPPRTLPPGSDAYFPPELLEKSFSRAKLLYINSGISGLFSFLVLYAVARRSALRPIFAGAFQGEVTQGKALLLGLCLGASGAAVFSLAGLPFDIYSFHINRSYGLVTMNLWTYLFDWAKGLVMFAAQYAAEGAFITWAAYRFRRTWHLVLGGAFVVASLCMNALYPVLIAPIFNDFHPLPEGTVLQDVRDLAAAAGMQVDEVLVMEASAKTTAANAYFSGVGKTKQVVLYDTLLSSQSREGIQLVVAHELGHWKAGDVLRSAVIYALGVVVLLFIFRVISEDARGTYVALERFLVTLYVFATVTSFVLNPISAYLSRRQERAADAYSLVLTGNNQAFIESQVRFGYTNLGDIEPPAFIQWFAGSHPSTMERIHSASKTN